MLPLVSVCMPVYNGEKYIDQAIDSILNQSYTNIEIIVVNDGSTDNTLNILNKYLNKGVKIFEQENKGQCAAANKAFHESTGEYIKFFDADDILSPDFIRLQVEKLEGKKNIVASSAWGRFYNDDVTTFKYNVETVWRDMKPIDWLMESLFTGHNMMQCGLWLIPREILTKSALWDERLSLINDFDFFIRVLLAAEEVRFAKGATLYYRSGINTTLSANRSRKALDSAFLSIQLGVGNILNYENSERVRKVGADLFRLWQYEFYPLHTDLYKKCRLEEKRLGGSSYKFPAGGTTLYLKRILGWKLTKTIKSYISDKVH
jgi:glycosyltransferase involved in cell wall biosynthesis